jgi:hypothetical protein
LTKSADKEWIMRMTRRHLMLIGLLAAGAMCCLSLIPADAAPGKARLHATSQAGTYAYGAPDASFDPLSATANELNDAGLPPRPAANADARAQIAWTNAVTAKVDRVIPELRQSSVQHGPHRNQSIDAGLPVQENAASTSTNWSGYALQKPSQPFMAIAGDWIVSDAVAPRKTTTCPGNYAIASTWVGIDGITSSDVFQAGTDSAAYCSSYYNRNVTQAWYEWYPANAVTISNLTIAAGDSVFVQIWATSPTQGRLYFVNFTTAKSVSLTFSAPTGTKLAGDSAEWIVEVPSVSTDGTTFKAATLPNFAQVFMTDAFASSADPTNGTVVPTSGLAPGAPGSATPVAFTLVDNSRTVLNSVTNLGPSSLYFQETPQ